MTTFTEIDVRCAVCGAVTRTATLTSTSSFGPPDLDLRPNGPARWAHGFRVQRCNACGYAARSIGESPPGAYEVVESPVYRGVLAQPGLPSLARSYFCSALVDEWAGNAESAGWRFLDAAWACDDNHAGRQARSCRERAVEMFERALVDGEVKTPPAVLRTVIADLWRRAGRFDDAVDACDAAVAELDDAAEVETNGVLAVCAFIRDLAAEGDDAPHSSAEAFASDA